MPPEVSHMVDQVTNYIKHWTDREINKLQANNDASICIPTRDGYRIGSYRLKVHPNKTCSVLNTYGELTHTFESKTNAILYTIYTIKQKYKTADQLLELDQEINKHYMDSRALQNGVKSARNQKDYVAVDIKQTRLDIAEKLLADAKIKLFAMHKIAKFNKVWL